ncbi:MAG: MauE/DoxX family redox-associated membrane protein [Planctomycetota bacterium]
MPTDILIRFVPATFLAIAGISKLADRARFAGGLGDFGVHSPHARRWISTIVPLVEIAVGAALFIDRASPLSTYAALVLVLVFTALLARARVRQPALRCHCLGGILRGESGALGIARNVVLIACLALCALRAEVPLAVSPGERALLVLAALALVMSYAIGASLRELRLTFGPARRARASSVNVESEAAA